MAILYYFNIRNIDKHEVIHFRNMLSKNRLRQIDKFQLKEDYLRSLLSEVMLRKKVGELIGINPQMLEIERNDYGKPFIKNVPDIHFNISHSGEWVVCIISEKQCGVDIEKIGCYYTDIAQKFFSESEYQLILQFSEEIKTERFYELWTLKESYVKFLGKGLSVPFNSFHLMLDNEIWKLTSRNDLHFKHIFIAEGYKAAVCMLEKELLCNKVESL